MSPGEVELYRVLYEHRDNPVTPTVKQLCVATCCNSRSAIERRLVSLEHFGYIAIERRGSGRHNTITLTNRRPAGFGRDLDGLWWCVEEDFGPHGHQIHPLTICHHPDHANSLSQRILADPRRKACWVRVNITIVEIAK